MLIGPFFYIPQRKRIIYNACIIEKGDLRADKYDNPYGHEQLWDDYFTNGDYINYPRGRVVYDGVNKRAVIYIDKCIDKPVMIKKITGLFEIDVPYIIEYDFHYQCVRCIGDIWKE